MAISGGEEIVLPVLVIALLGASSRRLVYHADRGRRFVWRGRRIFRKEIRYYSIGSQTVHLRGGGRERLTAGRDCPLVRD